MQLTHVRVSFRLFSREEENVFVSRVTCRRHLIIEIRECRLGPRRHKAVVACSEMACMVAGLDPAGRIAEVFERKSLAFSFVVFMNSNAEPRNGPHLNEHH